MPAPAHEVVDLFEVDASGEEAELVFELALALGDRVGPDFGGDEGVRSSVCQRRPEHGLGPPVHRRGVEEARPVLPDGGHHVTRSGLLAGSHVKRLPRTEADDGNLPIGPSETANLDHARSATAGAAALRPPELVGVRLARVDFGIDLVVRFAGARRAGRGVHVAELHLPGVGVRVARIGPLVIGVGPLGRIGIRCRLVEDMVHVRLGRRITLSHCLLLVSRLVS
jgi:hypothetical protein